MIKLFCTLILSYVSGVEKTHKDELFVADAGATGKPRANKFIHRQTWENTHISMNELLENPKVHSWPNPQKYKEIQ